MALDLQAIADVIRSDVMGPPSKSDAAIGQSFLRHLGLSRRMNGNQVLPVATNGSLYLYDDERGIWDELEFDDALSLIQQYDGKPYAHDGSDKKHKALEIGPQKAKAVHEAATLDLDHRDATFFDKALDGLAFKNGFVTVSADGPALQPHGPDHRATHCLPFEFDPEAECPEWTAVLKRVFDVSESPEDDAKLLQEFTGACLAGIAWKYARCLILSGGGNNGKSAVVELLTEQLFPPDAMSYASPQSWARPEFLSALRGAKLNLVNEMPDSDIQASDAFKAVIDGGMLMAKNLYENPYQLRPRAGHILLANTLPGTRDNTNGFWRRVLVLQFRRDFNKRPDETGRLRTKEEVKAVLRDEMPGIALWALWGAARLLRQGGYTMPVSHRRALEEWRCDVDQVAAFLNECCKVDGSKTYHSLIHENFLTWCKSTGRQELGNRRLASRLRALGIEGDRDGGGVYFRLNVMMKSAWGIGMGVQVNV